MDEVSGFAGCVSRLDRRVSKRGNGRLTVKDAQQTRFNREGHEGREGKTKNFRLGMHLQAQQFIASGRSGLPIVLEAVCIANAETPPFELMLF
ncbi:MAG: hypothetical protein JSU62_00175 [Gammaproteobacteria bacterium]|nr:MAG: hypothetical protein JSU62_00175 [Gammaproteobacteria bacterium]